MTGAAELRARLRPRPGGASWWRDAQPPPLDSTGRLLREGGEATLPGGERVTVLALTRSRGYWAAHIQRLGGGVSFWRRARQLTAA